VNINQILRVGYQLDSTAEMYLATVTTERERTGALLILAIPQATSMFFGPIGKFFSKEMSTFSYMK
jgi:hypothetical protein